MRTTDGRSALATAENADDSTRASLGASVLGVTVPPGASDGAGRPPAGAPVGLASSAFGGRRATLAARRDGDCQQQDDDSDSHRRYLTCACRLDHDRRSSGNFHRR